jgi:glutamyl-tRNA reductase
MKLLLVGTSHRLAPVEVRERVAVDADGAAALAARLAADGEAVCLSTCNRTEVYLAAEDPLEADRRATEALADLAAVEPVELEPHLYRLEEESATVTAYERGKIGPLLDRLFSHALHTGKKVRTDTAIAESPRTTSSAAAALAAQVFGDLAGAQIAIVGAGKIGTRTARRLTKRGASLSFVANRTEARGRQLAEKLGGAPIPLERLVEATETTDIVVSSTSSASYVLTKDELARALPARKGRPLLLIDLAVPRDLDPAINELSDCYLYDIDDLEAVVHETAPGREAEFAKAESIAAAEADRFREWLAARDVVPTIASLRERAEAIRRGELAKASGRLAGLSERERKAVDSLTSQIVNKLLHEPIVRLKEAATAEDRRGPENRLER